MPTLFQAIMILAAIGVVVTWGMVCNALYNGIQAKQMMLQQCPLAHAQLNNMYSEAKWLCRIISTASTYADLCEAEDQVDKFADGYRDCEGFEAVAYDLLCLLEQAKKVVRMLDKVDPVEIRYCPE